MQPEHFLTNLYPRFLQHLIDKKQIRPRGIGLLLSLALIVSAGAGAGCASTARDLGAAAAPAVVHAGLHEVNEADDQKELQRLADMPAFQHAGQSIGEGVGIGLFNQANKLAGGDANASASTDAATPVATPGGAPGSNASTAPASMPAAKTPGAAAIMGIAGGGGGLNGFVKSSVQEAFLAATDPQFKAGEEAMSEAIGEGFVSGMITVLNNKGPALGETIRKQLGPIFQELIREQIAPAVRDMLQQQLAPAALQVWREGAVETLKLTVRPDLQPDVQQNALNASVGAAHGTRQAMTESGVLTNSGELSPHLKIPLYAAGIGVGFALLSLLTLLIFMNLIVVRYWREGRNTESKRQ